MAKPTTKIPDSARNVEAERPQEGEEALRAVLEEYGGDYADAAEYTEELENVLETAILVIASADDDDVQNVTNSVVTLVEAANVLSTDGTVALAEGVGENGDALAEALDSVVDLQESGDLDALLEKAPLLAQLDVDEETVETMNRLLDAVDDAEEQSEPVGFIGAMRALGTREGRAGLGYAVSVLRGVGARLP